MSPDPCGIHDSVETPTATAKADVKGATVNPCTLCAPLGAVLATSGIEGAMALLHGAQGCATYIRRYLISHFREPIDVASSSFGESETVFGGESNLAKALDNVARQYRPKLVTIATTCVAETVGEDVSLILSRYRSTREASVEAVSAATPSYRDGHVEGYHAMVRAVLQAQSLDAGSPLPQVNLLAPILSPADLRHLRELVEAFASRAVILPDYSETLDGGIADSYRALPSGGTQLADIRSMARSLATIDLTMTGKAARAADILRAKGSDVRTLELPIGIRATDNFVAVLERATGRSCPEWLSRERARLLDAYADGHKYVFGKRVAVYGDPEFVVAVAKFLLEVGARPVVCATGARNRTLTAALAELQPERVEEVLDDTDFTRLQRACERTKVELAIGNSKGYLMTRVLGIPLLRAGFPIHDRIGAARLLSVGYRGTLVLFDTLVNTLLSAKQESSTVGFSYL
ncbi:MAG TPA: nitrogenase component 1 [Polyangiaceae bacterium]|nr:nitrogenase component 1 [Polyangiaceae bacterium]